MFELGTFSGGFKEVTVKHFSDGKIELPKGVGIAAPVLANVMDLLANNSMRLGGGYANGHLILGGLHIWVDATGRPRYKYANPTSDTGGSIFTTAKDLPTHEVNTANAAPTKTALNVLYNALRAGSTVSYPQITTGGATYRKATDSPTSDWYVTPITIAPN